MAGFGTGPFGQQGFGQWPLSKHALLDVLPPIYLDSDEANGGGHRKWADAVRPGLDQLQDRIHDLETLHDPWRAPTDYTHVRELILGPVLDAATELEQRGMDARVGAAREFIAPNGRFTSADRGKVLRVLQATNPLNARAYKVAAIISSTTVLLDPFPLTEAGPMRWELRAEPKSTQGSTTMELRGGDVLGVAPGWELFDGESDFKVLARREFHPVTGEVRALTDREGTDGLIAGDFISLTAIFKVTDVGKKIVLRGALTTTTNGRWEIGAVLSPTTVRLKGASGFVTLPAEAGPLTWAILAFPTLTVEGDAAPKGVIEQWAADATLTPVLPTQAQIVSPTALLTVDDLGKYVTIKSPGFPVNNNCIAKVIAVFGPGNFTVETVAAELAPNTVFVADTSVLWEVRQPTGVLPARARVQVHNPSMLEWLAKDFAIEVDRREEDARQRLWVASWSKWINRKGTYHAYEIIGLISGSTIVPIPLFRITQDIALSVPGSELVEHYDINPGRSGANGAFTDLITFTSPTAVFKPADVGLNIEITGAAQPTNNRWYTIDQFVNTTTVKVRALDQITAPEANSGALTWRLLRLYCKRPPLLPLFDEVNSDLMEVLIDGLPPQLTNFWSIDKYCWVADHVSFVSVTPTAAVALSSTTMTVTVTGPANVVVAIGKWRLTLGTKVYWLESVPSGGPAVWTFTVTGTVAGITPDLGVAHQLEYVCAPQLSCDYCQSHRLLLEITLGAFTGATEDSLEYVRRRILDRVEQVKPVHVEIIPQFQQVLEAVLTLAAEIEPAEVLAILYAALSYYFDDLPADTLITTFPVPTFPTDLMLGAEIEPPP